MKCHLAISAILLAATAAFAALTPDSFTFTWGRNDATALADTNVWLSGSSYLLIGNVVLDATGNLQDLTGVGGFIVVGDVATQNTYAITVDNTTSGLFHTAFVIPNAIPKNAFTSTTGIQLTLTSGATRVTYRGLKQLLFVPPLP